MLAAELQLKSTSLADLWLSQLFDIFILQASAGIQAASRDSDGSPLVYDIYEPNYRTMLPCAFPYPELLRGRM